MIIFGTRQEELDLGPVHPQDCEVCNKADQPFRLRLVYRYDHVWFVLGHVRALSYVIVCGDCGTPFRIPRAAGRKLGRLAREPIPLLRRYGCLLVFSAFVLIAGLAAVLGY
ncbi:hypothetical protein [Frigoriglobus tundricola]|uniref:Zinc-ribbon 15 domain-containing protein n=1 Tax=Frigoriglobus tundricola TaxID=2774151 RepID=A0A6M5YL95_9BACT|nr:hypothetical protein [Frigoriglobus tundricola]QJW93772.1 hypothetical protein FTUN_1283 [Frigoriglobus tundricola]